MLLWRDLFKLNLFAFGFENCTLYNKTTEPRKTKRNRKGFSVFFGGLFLTPLFPGVTLPFSFCSHPLFLG